MKTTIRNQLLRVTTGRVSSSRSIKFLAASLLSTALAAVSLQAQTFGLTNLFRIPVNVGNLANSTANRGMAYNALSNQVLVANTAPSISVFDGTVSNYIGNFSSMSGLSGGTLILDQIGVAGDGAIYGINLSTASTSPNRLYRWDNWLATPTVAFNANALTNGGSIPLTSGRLGDSMAVRGSGTGTEILMGVGGKAVFTIFYTTDGLNFTNTLINVPSGITVSANVYGICFYTNNTFLVKAASSGASTIYLIQYPANYASSALVTGTVLASTSLGSTYNTTTMLTYVPSASLLATVTTGGGSTTPVSVFNASNITSGATLLCTTNAATPNSNGNATGGAAMGGTNVVYAMDTANGLFAYEIIQIPPQPPAITIAPVGGTFYLSNTLSVTATGTQPLSYRWLASVSNSPTGTYTNIPGATTNTLSINTPSTNYYEVIITNTVGSTNSTPVQVAIITPVTSPVVTQLWRVAVGTSGYSYLANDNNSRGLGYDTNSQRLVVASLTGGSGLYILDANTGTNIGTLSLTGVSFGGLLGGVDQVVIADDGAVYAGNLVSGSGFTLFRWPAPTNGASGTQAFLDSGALGGADRWGDTMAVRGAGANTQIILGSRGGTNVALLTTADGVNFSGTFIAISNAPAGFAANGITFGAGNTLWAKAVLGHLYEIAFDSINQVGGVVLDYPNPANIPTYQVGVGIDAVNNLMSGVDLADAPNDVKLYQLTGTSDAPVLFNQSFFASANGNGNDNVAIAMKYPRLYALDVNNGLLGLTYGVPPTTAPIVSTAPATLSAYTNDPGITFSANASGSIPIYYQWQFSTSSNGPFGNIGGATGSSYTLSQPPLSAAGYYRVIVHNIAGYATSAPPSQLTLLVPITSTVVTQLWTLPAGTLPFLDGSSYNTRGLAYDTNSGTVLVADHNNIHLLSATNGSYLGDLNVLGAFNGGYAGWPFDQIGVADDGTLYAANLYGASLGGSGYVILSWAPGYTAGSPAAAFVYGGSGGTATGADPGNGSGDRWGDTMDVRGSGTGTEILIGSYSGTNVVLFTTADGVNFSANLIAVTNVPAGFSGQGIAFGDGDSFYTKTPGFRLRKIAFSRSTWTGGAELVYQTMPSAFGGIGVDVAANVLGGVNFSDSPNDLQLYLLSGNASEPSLFDQAFFGSNNINSQENAVTTLKGGQGFALNVNNGLTAVSYGTPGAPPVTITSVSYAPGNVTVTWNNVFVGHSYQVQYKDHLTDPSWTNLGSPVTTSNPTASASDTSAPPGGRFYHVVSQ